MNAVQGSIQGVAVAVARVRASAPESEPDVMVGSILHLLLSAKMTPARIGRIIAAFPKSERALYRACAAIDPLLFPPDDGREDGHEGEAA